MKRSILGFLLYCMAWHFADVYGCDCFDAYQLPEIYQDIIVNNKVIKRGLRSCSDRYDAIRDVLNSLPREFKVLDIGASQGYFSFRMAEDFKARCTMIEDGYLHSEKIWKTGDLLYTLCKKNKHLKNIALLQKQFTIEDFESLKHQEHFDLVLAFSVIHHFRKNETESFSVFEEALKHILQLAPVVLIENPVNTGQHTKFIRQKLIESSGQVIYTSRRGTLIYELFLFDRRNQRQKKSTLPNLLRNTFQAFKGSYSNIEWE